MTFFWGDILWGGRRFQVSFRKHTHAYETKPPISTSRSVCCLQSKHNSDLSPGLVWLPCSLFSLYSKWVSAGECLSECHCKHPIPTQAKQLSVVVLFFSPFLPFGCNEGSPLYPPLARSGLESGLSLNAGANAQLQSQHGVEVRGAG